ncbi:MAG: RpiB/LacA/LacB family sugar-phosphate isomerase [archaeon]|jgi:ribose 5-phosphate isomerase B|nr:RpiB/LacA/LacB family sugar-phosphate isomerase [archaeon]
MIYLGADHAGFQLKEDIKKYLLEVGMEVEDMGAYELNEQDDYPDFIIPVAEKVAADPEAKGIIFGGSGQGEDTVADKVKGIRSAVYYGGPVDIVKLSRQHNDANILSLGARFLNTKEAQEAVTVWLNTEFEGGRHERRVNKIAEIEKE